ncbi:hypothetical protein M6B38_234295 [Iris pallida]|uniref:Uncharacterized protein n=1 Tax=Iris pallida TaxID=29817 RepID=A0AAX6DQ45_IRIPA|nr:hypothetical protein M6B38_234295 [Iris pallida]
MGESGDMFGLQSIVRCSRLGIIFSLDCVRVLQLCIQIVFVCACVQCCRAHAVCVVTGVGAETFLGWSSDCFSLFCFNYRFGCIIISFDFPSQIVCIF